MRVLVCGSRSWPEDDDHIVYVLEGVLTSTPKGQMTVIEGGARGADRVAAEWASSGVFPLVHHEQYPADWRQFGRRAGYLRNVEMLESGNPDLVLAFVDKPLNQSKGTAMMVKLARAAGVPVYVTERFHG